jgi:uncharacterized protein YqgV (UPF0045/DUF77 family)
MATADLTVIGLGRSDLSAYKYIAAIQRRLPVQDRVKHVLNAMGTSLERETADIQALVGELHAVPFELGLPRVYSLKTQRGLARPYLSVLRSQVEGVRRRLIAVPRTSADQAFSSPGRPTTGPTLVRKKCRSGPGTPEIAQP